MTLKYLKSKICQITKIFNLILNLEFELISKDFSSKKGIKKRDCLSTIPFKKFEFLFRITNL